MNPKQARKVERLTNAIDRAARTSDGEGWMNGPVVFKVEQDHSTLWFYATNLTPEKRWFETTQSVMAVIGVRGGVTLYNAEGLIQYAVGRCTDRSACTRPRRTKAAA